MEDIIKLKNRLTGDIVAATFHRSDNLRTNGLTMNELLKEAAYKLGCGIEDLIRIDTF